MMNTAPEKSKIEIPQDKKLRVCFVCTGNTCRSPMAAAVLNHLAPERFDAFSAGIMASDGDDMSAKARKALEWAGIDAPPHSAHRLNRADVAGSDIVIGMTANHVFAMLQGFPEYASKIEAMERDVGDPYGGDLALYEQCLADITDALKERFAL